MLSLDELLEEMDAILDKAMVFPMSGGKALVNVERMRELIDDVRLHLPQEIRQARAVVAERNDLIASARKEAESITRKAEERARTLVNNDEIVRRANIQSNETIAQAQTKAREIRKGATDYAEGILHATEDVLNDKLTELRQSRQSLRTSARNDSTIQPSSDSPKTVTFKTDIMKPEEE